MDPVRRSLAFALLALAAARFANAASTLDRVREGKTLRCGINQETPEYSTADDHGPRAAFDADLCRAVAIAIAGPEARVVAVPYPDDASTVAALRAGRVDLIPSLTLDFSHDAGAAFAFTPPVLYDGAGFLAPLDAPLQHAAQLDGKAICFLAETGVETSLRAWFTRQRLKFVPFPFQEEGEMEAAFVTGNCAALAGDLTRLAATRLEFGPLAGRYALLPEQISQDPLAAASRADDPAFAAVVRWTFEVLLQAEALGLTRENIARFAPGGGADKTISAAPDAGLVADPEVAMLTGKTQEIGARLLLDDGWALRVVGAVGNYAEMFARDVGEGSPLKLPQGLNRLYTDGGLMYPMPLK
jgi:general L-amino acid transport system substrate-binding protein